MSDFDENETTTESGVEPAKTVDTFEDFEKPVVSEIALPPVNKKKNRLLMLLIPVAVLVVVAIGGLIVYARAALTPFNKVKKAIEKTAEFSNPYEDLLGYSELTKKITDLKPYSKGGSISLQQIDLHGVDDFDLSSLEGAGLTLDSSIDYDKELGTALIGINYGDAKCLSLKIKLDGDKLYAQVPELLDASFVIDFSTLGRDLRSSKLLEDYVTLSDTPIPYELSVDLWNFLRKDFLKELTKELKKQANVFIDGIKVEKADLKDIDLPEGVSAKNAYAITVSELSIKTLAEESISSILKFLKSEMKEKGIQEKDIDLPTDGEVEDLAKEIASTLGTLDIVLTVGKKGTVTYVSIPFAIEDQKLTATLRFKDSSNPYEEAVFSIVDTERNSFSTTLLSTKDGSAAFKYDLRTVIDTDDQYSVFNVSHRINARSGEFILSCDASTDDRKTIEFKMEGAFEDIIKGKRFSTNIDNINISIPDQIDVTMVGTGYVDTTKAKLNFEPGKEYYVLALDDTDLMLISTEAMTNIQNNEVLSELFGTIE